jgi:hypothetical protein
MPRAGAEQRDLERDSVDGRASVASDTSLPASSTCSAELQRASGTTAWIRTSLWTIVPLNRTVMRSAVNATAPAKSCLSRSRRARWTVPSTLP